MKSADFTGKNILFIAYYFPPVQSIGVWRNYFLAREAKKVFANVFVSVRKLNTRGDSSGVSPETFHLIENPAPDYRYILGNKKKVGFSEGVKRNFFSRFFIRLINSFPFNILIGEGGIVYLISSVRQASKTVNEKNIGFIYSSFRPMTDHLIAYCLKRRNKNLVWTADFRDLPFDPLYKHYFFYGFQRWVMKRILSHADIITTFTAGIAEGLKNFTNKKIVILENGPFEEFSPIKRLPVGSKYFTIQYTGSLFQDERNPGMLMQAIAEMIKENSMNADVVRLKYAGKDDSQWKAETIKFGIELISEIHGLVSRDEAGKLQSNAQLNLLLTSSHPEYQGILTGKFFELILTGHPIICLINGSRDTGIENLFEKYHLGIVVYNDITDKDKLKEFLKKMYDNFTLTGSTGWQINESIYEDFNWTKTMEKWTELLEHFHS